MDANKVFLIFAIVTVFMLVSDRILFVILPNYLLNKNFSATQVGLVFSITSFILLISRFFIGKISDIVGRKTIMCGGLLLESITILFYPMISRFYQFSLVKGLQELSNTLSESVKDALIADIFKKRIRATVIRKLGNTIPIGKAFAMLVGFIITTYFSLVTGFYVAAFSLFISSILFLLIKEVKPKSKNQLKVSFSLKKYPTIFKMMIVIGFLQAIVFTIAYYPGFFILARTLGITENLLFLILLLVYVSGGVIIFLTKRFVDRVDKLKLTLVNMAAFSFFIILYLFSKSVLQFFMVLFFVHLFYAYYWIGFKAILLNTTTRRFRGEQLGFYKTMEGIGGLIGPAVGGFLIDIVSLSSAFLLAGTIGLVAVISTVIIINKLI